MLKQNALKKKSRLCVKGKEGSRTNHETKQFVAQYLSQKRNRYLTKMEKTVVLT